MPDRIRLASSLFFLSSTTVLACLLVGQIRASQIVTVSIQSDCDRVQSAAQFNSYTAIRCATMMPDAVLEEDALPYETEEQERADALDESRGAFLIPSSFRIIADRRLIVLLSIVTPYPLRC